MIAGKTWLPLQCPASPAAGMFVQYSSGRVLIHIMQVLPEYLNCIDRSDLCPSTTVSSSTSTGTLTDTGTITEVKSAFCCGSYHRFLKISLKEHPPPVAAPWRACAICLEDMIDSDLVSHIHCTAVLCR